MEHFHLKDSFSLDDIQSLIDNEAEESTYLEFKSAEALEKSDNKKREIAKDVCAFANSDGGVLIYGLKEDNHKAKELSFIDGNIFTKEWLEQVISSKIQQSVRSITIFPIRVQNKIEQSIYVVKILSSNNAPHQVGDKYYRRANFEVYPMQELEVRTMYNIKTKTELSILGLFKTNINADGGQKNDLTINPEIQIKNISNSIEFHYKLEIGIPSILNLDSAITQKYQNGFRDGLKILTIPNSSPLYQGEVVTFANILYCKVYKHSINEFLQATMKLRLFYSNGLVEKDYNFSDTFTLNNRKITINDIL